ncbi:MAG TPA: hypothetical protein VHE83_15905 [Mycobacteriales bacterium]|nr:hypothetical protein [Mycobacteriales bacterium]
MTSIDGPRSTSRLPKPVRALLARPRVWTWAGLLVVAVGIVLITIGWGDVAGTEVVGDQLPYLMSAGLGGLAAVCIGITIVAIDAKLSDAAARQAQAAELREALAELAALEASAR